MTTAPPPPTSGPVPPPAPPPPSTAPSALPHEDARLDSLRGRHMALLRRLDRVESAMAAGTASRRRRFVASAASSSGHRRTHARVFVSHRVEGDGGDGGEGEDGNKSGKKSPVPPAGPPAAPAAAPAPVPNSRHGGKDLSAMKQAHAGGGGAEARPTTMGASTQPRRGQRRWTLVIEGGLLVPQVDHDSAREVDARLAAGRPVLGCRPGPSPDDCPDGRRPEIPLRDQWRGGTGEVEGTVGPVRFTHLFDRLEVEMKAYRRPRERDGDGANAAARGGPPQPPPAEEEEGPVAVRSYTWVRDGKDKRGGSDGVAAGDAHAFFVPYIEDSEFRPMGGKVFKSEFNVERVEARAKLYRRGPPESSGECDYAPARELCDVFFPTFAGGRAAGEPKGSVAAGKSNSSGGGGGSKSRKSGSKRKRSSAGGGGEAQSPKPPASAAREEAARPVPHGGNDNPPAGGGGAGGGGKGAAFERMQREAGIEPKFSGTPLPLPLDRDVYVPPTVTLDEVLCALLLYVRGRNLQDPADPATVNCDADLERLFGTERLAFSSVRKLLLERRLIVPVSRPIVLNYEMTVGGAEPLTGRRRKDDGEREAAGTRRKSSSSAPPPDGPDGAPAGPAPDGPAPVQSMLSFDLDVAVPDLYPPRVRELLRRANHREFAFAGPRLRAEKSLVASGLGQSDARRALAVAASGRTCGPYQGDVSRALARGASAGGEAEVASLVDLRTVALCERLDGLMEGRAACLSVLGTVLAGRGGRSD